MKYFYLAVTFFLVFGLISGCATQEKHHETNMPEPESFNAHFDDMDKNGDALVNWEEFKAFFPQATPEVFQALDLNKDGSVDHDEWHEFKAAHGLGHKE